MASPEVLKEYLIKLGYKSDDAGSRRFVESLSAASETVNRLGDALKALLLGEIAKKFVEVAESLDEVYQAALRTGSSVQGLQSLGKAFSLVGSSAEAAMDMVKNLHRFITMIPSGETIIQQLGVQTRDTQGRLRETTKMTDELMASMYQQAQQGPANAASIQARGQQLFGGGFDIETLNQWKKVQQEKANYNKMVKESGGDPEQEARNANRFVDGLTKVGWALEIIRDKIAGSLFKQFGIDLEHIADWLSEHSQKIADGAITIAKSILAFFQSVFDWIRANSPKIEADFDKLVAGVIWLGKKVKDEFNAWEPSLEKIWRWVDKLVTSFTSWQHVIEAIIALKFMGFLFALTGIGPALVTLGGALTAAWAPWLAAIAGLAAIGGGSVVGINLILDGIQKIVDGIRGGPGVAAQPGWSQSLDQHYAIGNAKEHYKQLLAMGLSPFTAAAMAATAQVESGGNPEASNTIGGGHAGVYQLSQAKQREVEAHYAATHGGQRKSVQQMTVSESDAEWVWVMSQGSERGPGQAVMHPRSLQEAVEGMHAVERFPGWNQAGNPDAAKRLLIAQSLIDSATGASPAAGAAGASGMQGYQVAPGSTVAINSNNTTTVTNNPVTTVHINAESPDPQAIAQNVSETMDRVYGNMVRYLGAAIA